MTNMQQNGVYDLLKLLEISLDEGFPIIPRRYTIVKTKEIETLIDRIYAALPVEVQEARAFLRRREELQLEAQQKAERIINDAQMEADRKLSEADFIKALEKEGIRIRTQVQEECEEIKRKAMEEAENIRIQATEEAMKTREGAELYAELEKRLKALGITNLYAIIMYPGYGSVEFHEHMGYHRAGILHNCGDKFGKSWSVIYMEKFI